MCVPLQELPSHRGRQVQLSAALGAPRDARGGSPNLSLEGRCPTPVLTSAVIPIELLMNTSTTTASPATVQVRLAVKSG